MTLHHQNDLYQVCEKWLKDRQKAHRKLNIDDINHYQKDCGGDKRNYPPDARNR